MPHDSDLSKLVTNLIFISNQHSKRILELEQILNINFFLYLLFVILFAILVVHKRYFKKK